MGIDAGPMVNTSVRASSTRGSHAIAFVVLMGQDQRPDVLVGSRSVISGAELDGYYDPHTNEDLCYAMVLTVWKNSDAREWHRLNQDRKLQQRKLTFGRLADVKLTAAGRPDALVVVTLSCRSGKPFELLR
jgi:hypothetical protein